jgi:hypothetical protein
MKSMRARLAALEVLESPAAAQCFWCECEGLKPSPTCEHSQWKPIAHETALALLAEAEAHTKEECNAVS